MPESMEQYVNTFESILSKATASIEVDYIQLPMHGREDPIYRERVYCYELYHQLRVAWPSDFPFSLGGEVDKNGHPLFREEHLLKTKPDLLVHQPGNMDGNLIVLEVKPVNARSSEIVKDLSTLTAFRRSANYTSAIYLIYGNSERSFSRLKNIAESTEQPGSVDLRTIKLYWHSQHHEPATRFEWSVASA